MGTGKMYSFLILFVFLGVAFARRHLLRIHKGKNESILHSPYQVLIYFNKTDDVFCGGAIISAIHIVTAAHCFYPTFSKIDVYAGSPRAYQGQHFDVASYKIHRNFNPMTAQNDVAIITLTCPLIYSNKIKPIKLAEKLPRFGSMLKVAGWGYLNQHPPPSKFLQSAKFPLLDPKECNFNFTTFDSKAMICAGYKHGPSDCPGDSGGPVVWNGFMVGIVSFGPVCGTGASAYTNVPEFRSWIIDHMHWDKNAELCEKYIKIIRENSSLVK